MKKSIVTKSPTNKGNRGFLTTWMDWFILEHAFRNEKAVRYLEKRSNQFV